MSTPAPRLELVPPTPQPSAEAPSHIPMTGAVRSEADRRAFAARMGRVMLRCGVAACAVIPLVFLFGPQLGEAGMVTLLLPCGMVIVGCGIGLLGLAVVERTRATFLALMVGILSLFGAIALAQLAIPAAAELHVAMHQVELDALAADVRAVATGKLVPSGSAQELNQRLTDEFRPRLREVGMNDVAVVDGGLLFSPADGPGVLYADGVAGPADPCPRMELRALGGRWYERRCYGRRGGD